MSKKCTPLWREAHLEVKSVKALQVRCTFWRFDGESMSKKCTLLWREAHFQVKSGSKPPVFDTFDLEMCFAPQWRALFRRNLKKEFLGKLTKVPRVANINCLLTISLHYQGKRLWEGNAVNLYQILSTNTLRKYMGISLENLCVDNAAYSIIK